MISIRSFGFALGSGALSNQTGISTKVMSQGFAFAGVADDPSAIFYNPAGLVQVKGLQLMAGTSVLGLATKHTTTSGTQDNMARNTPLAPYLYLSYSDPSSKLAYGVGVNSPFGLITEWKDDSFSKYYATKSEILMYMVNPTVAYSLTDNFSIGGGLDYLNIFKTELNALTPNSLTGGTSDGHSKVTGNGSAWGYNAGLHWKANDQHSFGLSYRSQVNVPVIGTTEVTEQSGLLALGFGGTSYKTGMSTEFKFPQSVLFGYGFKPNNKWTIYADYEWDDWKVVQETKFNYEQPNSNLTTTIPRQWTSTNNLGVGAEWKATQTVDLRFGALTYERVVPPDTLESTLPDSSRFVLTLGSGFHWGGTSLDLGYNAIFFNSRSVQNSAGNAFASMNGKFETMINVVAIGISQKWGGS